MIKAVNLQKSFRTGGLEVKVLKGVDLEIVPGEMVAIVGASGVGKSTLLHILGTLERPTVGEVLFHGEHLFQKSESELAAFRNRQIGFVFQFHHLLPEFTALENVAMPALIAGMRHAEALSRAGKWLARMGLSDRLHHRPGELSGGEQQRVATARALIHEPRIVLADEPTGNLDTAAGDALFQLMRSLNEEQGIGFVVVTHNEQLAGHIGRTLRMVDGRIAHP